ncbi:hypothetical protein VB716_08575 [Synechococcus sp. CCY9201]|uniref:variant leucine-rich repeat-containing protein n=1 Tax=unclassified Synechococcus TaxID=2626047 RepID=UPI0018CCE481|nr:MULTISPECIES: hypothetical protein [unclassified Synechococcus]MEA5474274.1 hypothetical protein [Synechococcus sp. CCY9201]QPN59710.1 hypothetical protein H8F24_17430 [Synechococcus sp. CBW1002]
MDPNDEATEARSPDTSPARLRQLAKTKILRPLIAANPNVDEELLWELAVDHPEAVIKNPKMDLFDLGVDPWWERCESAALLKLLVELGVNAPQRGRDQLVHSIADELRESSPLAFRMEWHQRLTRHIFIAVAQDTSEADSSDESIGSDDQDAQDDAFWSNADDKEQEEYSFTLEFCSIVEDCFFDLEIGNSWKPHDSATLLKILIALGLSESGKMDLTALPWDYEHNSTLGGQGYWQIDKVDPDLPGWEFDLDVDGFGEGVLTVIDPTGFGHHRDISSEADQDYLNPELDRDLAELLFGGQFSIDQLHELLPKALVLNPDSAQAAHR